MEGDELNNYLDYMRKPNADGILQHTRNTSNTLSQIQGSTTCEEMDSAGAPLTDSSSSGDDQVPSLNRYSYRAAIYRTEAQQDIG